MLSLPWAAAARPSQPHLTAMSPSANTRLWCSARSVGSVCSAPRALVAKGSAGPARSSTAAAPGRLTGACPALHSTKSASRI